MKKIFSLLLVLVMLLTVCIPAMAAEEATLLYSYGGFEAKDKSIMSGSMRKGYEYSEDCAHTGSVSLKAIGSEEQSGGWLWLKNTATFEKGKTYSVRFFATTDGDSASVTAELFISGGNTITGKYGSQAIPVGSWGEYVAYFTWEKDETAASVLLKFGGEGNIYIDDLEIYEGMYEKTAADEPDIAFEEISPGASGVNVYVDMNAANGGDGSKAAPFNTIEAAQNYVRTINKNMTQDIVVNIKGGTYTLTDTILLTDKDSGTNGYHVIYQPYGYDSGNYDNVVISGGKKVEGWTNSEIDGVYKASLDVDYLRNLYVNGTRAQRARYNEYVTPISWWDDTENTLSTKDGFVIPGGIIKNPEKATNLELYRTATFRSNWAVKGQAVADGENTIIKMAQPNFFLHEFANLSVLEWKIENNFRLENALEFLDEPGEWYHDADTDTLYYMPRSGETMDSIEVIAPDVERLLDIRGSGIDNRAENIIVRGLTFSHGAYKRTSRLGRANLQSTACYSVDMDGSGYAGAQITTAGNINMINARNVSLRDNVINHMGAVAIAMPNAVDNCELRGNAIYDVSSSAVTIGSLGQSCVSHNGIVPKNVLITNNVIGKTGIEYESDPSVQSYYTNGLIISHNEVYNSTYSGICVGWDWENVNNTKKRNIVEYNRIYNYGTACQDGGAIYTLGRHPDSVVKGNYILCYEQDIVGIYHDEGSSGFTTTDNVVDMPADSVSSGLYNHSFLDELYMSGNYTNVINSTSDFTNFCDNFTDQGITRSPDALAIRANAGLEDEYKSVRGKISDYSDNAKNERIYLQTAEQKHQTPASINVGESLTLVALAESRNGEISEMSEGLSFKVSDESVLNINGNKITAVSEGISNVTVTDANGNTATMQVTVGDELVSFEVIASKNWAEKDESIDIAYRLKTKYTEYTGKPNKSAISVDNGVLKVITDGTVKAMENGTATVTANVQCGKFTASGTTKVTVSDVAYRTFKKLGLNSMLTREEILSALGGNESSSVTEKNFVDVLASIIQVDGSKICESPSGDNINKEEMVALVADTLVSVYGKAPMHDTELHQYTDREAINPSLVPKIALAYECGLLSWMEVSSAFEPQKAMTQGDAADFLYRFARPEKFDYLRMDSYRLSTYKTVAEWLFTRNYGGMHSKIKQINYRENGEETVEINNTVHNGTQSSAVVDGELVHKITRSTTRENTVFLINGVDFVPGKKYNLSFAAKLSSASGLFVANKNNFSINPKFTVTEDSDTVSGAEVNATSWTEFSFNFAIPADSAYPVENNSIWMHLTNTTLDSNLYDVYFKDMVITETADATITASTIADGEENVMTPIDGIYIRVSGALKEDTVTVDKFTVSGGTASVSAVDLVDENTIKVSLAGIDASTDYTLTVSGVATLTGGALSDTLSWTTAPKPLGKTGVLDFETTTKGIDGSSVNEIESVVCSDEIVHEGKKSAKITTITHGNMFINTRYAGFANLEVGKTYHASYWIYSPNKAMRTGIYKFSTAGSASNVGIVPYTTISKGEWTYISGTFTIAEESQTNDVLVMAVFDNPGTCYVDDFRISEVAEYPVTVHRPNIFTNGVPANRIGEGTNRAEIKITGAEKDYDICAVAVQYDDNGRMARVETSYDTVTASSEKTVVINLPYTQNLKTKIFVMDANTFAPYMEAIVTDKIVK